MKISGILASMAVAHVYLHVMLWWRFYGVEISESFFMLASLMVLLFAGTMLLPEEEEGEIDIPVHFE